MKRLSPHTWAIIKIASIALLLLVLLFAILGCESPTKTISRNAQIVTAEVPKIMMEADAIDLVVASTDYADPVRLSTDRIRDSGQRVDTAASGIRDRIPGIQDRPTTFMRLLAAMAWWGKAILLIAVILFLWYLGIGSVVRGVFLRIGLFVSPTKMREVRMDLRVLDREEQAGGEEHPAREAIAAKRARDPEYAAAWTKLKRQKEFVS